MTATAQPSLDLMRFPLHGLRLIEASAGTGKTFSIAALYVRLVLGHGRGEGALTPPEILVLTFTRAATRELRDRIRGRLTEAAAAFRSGQCADDSFIEELLAAYPDEHARLACARRLQVAAEWMDEAAIHTIHAWCQTLLRQHAFDSGSLFDQDVEATDSRLLKQVVNDYWRRFMYIEHTRADRLTELAATPADLAARLRRLLKPGLELRVDGRPDRGLAPAEALDWLAEFERRCFESLEPLRRAWQDQRAAIVEAMQTAVDQKWINRPYNKDEERRAWFERLDAWDDHGAVRAALGKLRHDEIAGALSSKARKAGITGLDQPWFAQVAAVLDSLPETPRWTARVWPHLRAWVEARYRDEKRQRNRLDFDDLLVRLDDALAGDGGDRLRRRILDSFPVALIDEFQDTDPIQYRIFERVFLPERDNPNHGLFMIGDPKQAIYSFRGADIHVYLAARRETASDRDPPERFTLPTNYRSTRAMVDAVGALFGCGEQNPDGAFGFRVDELDPVPFLPVTANGRDETLVVGAGSGDVLNEHPALTLWHLAGDDGKACKKGAYQKQMAAQTASEVERLLSLAREAAPGAGLRGSDGRIRPLRASDMAVLVRTGREADLVQRQFRQRGIDSVYLSERSSIFDQPEAMDVLAVLEAAAAPTDDGKLRSALATPSLCAALDELDALNRDERRLDRELRRFAALNRVWREHGVLAMLRRLLFARRVPARLHRFGAGGERTLTNLLHLAELLQVESAELDGEQGLIDWLRERIADTDRLDNDEHLLRLESDADLVKVVTVFKAKGLQYPLVFVPFAASARQVTGSDEFLEYHERGDDGRDLRVVELAGSSEALGRARCESLQEDLRLLYVALTRCEHACWVGLASIAPKDAKAGPVLSAPDHLLDGLLTDAERQAGDRTSMGERLARLRERSENIDVVAVGSDSIREHRVRAQRAELRFVPARIYEGRSREDWWIASYSALRHGQAVTDGPGDAESALRAHLDEMARDDRPAEDLSERVAIEPKSDSIHGFPRGAEAGTWLHLLLEWAGRQGFAALHDQPRKLQDEIRTRLERRGWARWNEVVVHWMDAVLVAPIRLGECELRLVDLSDGAWRYTPELEFWFEADRVDVTELDRRVSAHTLGGRPRAPFRPGRLNGMLHGFIDLVFEHEGRWYVADYKSNVIGPTTADYGAANLAEAVAERRYDMQYTLYLLALHRLLKSRLGAEYDPARQLGGAAYLFLRGCEHPDTAGVFFEAPDVALIEQLDALFSSREVAHGA